MHRTRAFFLLLLTSFASLQGVIAQHPVYRHFSVEDGLPSSELYHIIQDSKGFIWIATNMGVCRYDGMHFIVFDTQDGLPENTVFDITEDKAGRIWFVSFPCQLSYFDGKRIVEYKYNNILREFRGYGIVPEKGSLIINNDGSLYLSLMRTGLIYVSNKGKLVIQKQFPNSNSINLGQFHDRLVISRGLINLNGDFINIQIPPFRKLIPLPQSEFYANANFYFAKSDSAIFIGKNEYIISVKKGGVSDNRSMGDKINFVNSDANNVLWIGTDGSGLFGFENGDVSKKPTYHYLDGNAITAFCIDREGGKWFTTIESGLFYLPSDRFYSLDATEGLTGNRITSISKAGKYVFFSTMDPYINFFDGNHVKNLRLSENPKATSNKVYFDGNDVLWIGTNEYLYSTRKDLFNSNSLIKKYFPVKLRVKEIISWNNDSIFVSEAYGLNILKNQKVVYNSITDDSLELRIEALARVSSDKLLIGSFKGLWSFAGGNLSYLGNANPKLQKRITALAYYEPLGLTAIGTKGEGLLLQLNDTLIEVNRSNGLSSNSVSCLFIQNDELWIGSNYGVNLINLKNIGTKPIVINHYNSYNGLISNEVNDIDGDADNIYIATNNGLTVFNYRNYFPVSLPPPVYISNFKVMNRDTSLTQGLKLAASQSMVSIDYIGVVFNSGGRNAYYYRLKGLADNWNYTTSSQVEYAYLPPGEYVFEVLAVGPSGIKSASPAVFNFSIDLPFWKTWWFILIASIVAISLIVMLYLYRLKQMRKQHNLRNDINWYRQQALARQMDPHFVFNTLNSIQSFIIKNDRIASSQYLSKFAKLMRLILNNSQKQAIPLSDEISALALYLELESLRFQKKFQYNLKIDPSIESTSCFIPAFFIQPFVENAIWHGIMPLKGAGIISIDLQKTENSIACIVEDNGIGRQKSKELNEEKLTGKRSHGIELVLSRVKLINSLYGTDMRIDFDDLYSDSGEPAGTRVFINLPLIS